MQTFCVYDFRLCEKGTFCLTDRKCCVEMQNEVYIGMSHRITAIGTELLAKKGFEIKNRDDNG